MPKELKDITLQELINLAMEIDKNVTELTKGMTVSWSELQKILEEMEKINQELRQRMW
jgi:hypothetical protein